MFDIKDPFKCTRTSKIPDIIKHSLDIMASNCPCCGNSVSDKRYKRSAYGSPLIVRNFSDTGITLECRSCKFRFHFTWRNFVNVLKGKNAIEPHEQMKLNYDNWIVAIEHWFGLNEPEVLAKIQSKLIAIKEAKIK